MREILNFCVDRITAEMIIGVITRMAIKEISGSAARIDFRGMIEDLTIEDTNLEMGVKMTILVEGTAEIEVITAQRAKSQNVGIVELKVQIREFEKPWLFHVLLDLEYPCNLGVDLINGSKNILDFDRKSLVIPDSQIDTVVKTIEEGNPYRYDRVKQAILDYHVQKILKEGTIIPIQSPYASPVVLCRKNNGLPADNPEAYRFAVDYRKLKSIAKYPRYPLPLKDDLITNIPHMTIMSTLDLKLGYFQLAENPTDIVKTPFDTKNSIYAFRRVPFGLPGVASNF
ncbi:uncharacterized protein TNCV_3697741 [Trichonephila clavipes]|uniref:Transposon Ty3-I Gag-Pol polyprotein n=1 Tax=Trichonephila clavipes TaxID=2585209 RepID=A0A8X6S9C6_TRICX|nr:uncharacterized protein TNCV_3697741 [Trichonephila clavipes]